MGAASPSSRLATAASIATAEPLTPGWVGATEPGRRADADVETDGEHLRDCGTARGEVALMIASSWTSLRAMSSRMPWSCASLRAASSARLETVDSNSKKRPCCENKADVKARHGHGHTDAEPN